MVAEGTRRPQVSAVMPPRKINVQKYAESRALELESLHSIISNRLNGDYRSQRNKRRRTTAFDKQITRKGCRRKRQKLGIFDDNHSELNLDKDQTKKLPRHVRRRHELRMNPEIGFCTSGDGTKRLRTHVWHAKRFTMTKLWGYHLPLGLPGRGRGSRAILKRFKEGALVHDASYYSAIQLEGPEDSIISVLRKVLVPSPSARSENSDDSILSGIIYGAAMLYKVEAPVSEAIAPVTYMWRPMSQHMSIELEDREHCTSIGQHEIRGESMKTYVSESRKSDGVEHGASFRRLWVWIHASALKEGYDTLKRACQKEMIETGIMIDCVLLEGQLAKLDLMGSGAFQLLQKILHPISGVSEKHWELRKHVATEKDYVSQNRWLSMLKDEEHFSSYAMLSLNVKDPRELPKKRTTVPVEPTSTEVLFDAQEAKCKELTPLEEILDMNEDLPSSSCSKLEDNQFGYIDLWDVTTRGVRPPVEESVFSREKHHNRMLYFCLGDENCGEVNSSTKMQCSRSCPIILLKNDKKGLAIGWSVILPLSWVKTFWISLVSHGGHAIGLREKHWIASEIGLPFFPADFPDCKAYSCSMATKAATFDQKAELCPPFRRPFRVPFHPWSIVRNTCNKEINAVGSPEVSTREDANNANSLRNPCGGTREDASNDNSSPNSCGGSLKISSFDYDGNSFDGIVARTGCMLTAFLNEIQASQLLIFPHVTDRKTRISEFMKGETKIDLSHRSSILHDRKLCFLRVHLRAYKEGFFEEGAVVCAPRPSDISLWTSGSVKSEGGLQISQSAVALYFKGQSSDSGKWEMHIPDDANSTELHRWPIGFVTTAYVQGSKRRMAEGFCEAALLAHLREEQWKDIPAKRRKREIHVLVRNLKSVSYRLALAFIVLEHQENDIESL